MTILPQTRHTVCAKKSRKDSVTCDRCKGTEFFPQTQIPVSLQPDNVNI